MFTEERKKLETQKEEHETQKEKEQRKEKNILLNFTLLLSLAFPTSLQIFSFNFLGTQFSASNNFC